MKMRYYGLEKSCQRRVELFRGELRDTYLGRIKGKERIIRNINIRGDKKMV